jgi:hypothetical protein
MDASLAFLHNIYSNLSKQSWIVATMKSWMYFISQFLLNTELVKTVNLLFDQLEDFQSVSQIQQLWQQFSFH